MKELEERIITDGEVLSGNILKVGSFLNQKIDCSFCWINRILHKYNLKNYLK